MLSTFKRITPSPESDTPVCSGDEVDDEFSRFVVVRRVTAGITVACTVQAADAACCARTHGVVSRITIAGKRIIVSLFLIRCQYEKAQGLCRKGEAGLSQS